jgi:hypothetical protein
MPAMSIMIAANRVKLTAQPLASRSRPADRFWDAAWSVIADSLHVGFLVGTVPPGKAQGITRNG